MILREHDTLYHSESHTYIWLMVWQSIQQRLRESPNHASTKVFPRFFYPPGQYDPNDLFVGLLRGELLVYVSDTSFNDLLVHILFCRLSNTSTSDLAAGRKMMAAPEAPVLATPSLQTCIGSLPGHLLMSQLWYATCITSDGLSDITRDIDTFRIVLKRDARESGWGI